MACCNVFEKFGAPNNVLKEYKYWKIQITPEQLTLGSCVIIPNKHVDKISNSSKEELEELETVKKELESALKKAFKSDKFDFSSNSNSHLVFHVIPRYEKEINFANVIFKDKDWPKPPYFSSEVPELDPLVFEKIKLEIYHNLL